MKTGTKTTAQWLFTSEKIEHKTKTKKEKLRSL